jgi:hypothetical protein
MRLQQGIQRQPWYQRTCCCDRQALAYRHLPAQSVSSTQTWPAKRACWTAAATAADLLLSQPVTSDQSELTGKMIQCTHKQRTDMLFCTVGMQMCSAARVGSPPLGHAASDDQSTLGCTAAQYEHEGFQ